MEDKLREIVSVFINKPVGEIGAATLIGKSAISNSIMIHRMYAKLAEAGVVIGNYRDFPPWQWLPFRPKHSDVHLTCRAICDALGMAVFNAPAPLVLHIRLHHKKSLHPRYRGCF